MLTMNTIMSLIKKHEEIIRYLIAGILTTIVSIVSYYLFRIIRIHYLISTILSWILAVIFAYFVNKFYVFKNNKKDILEFVNFIKYRLISLLMEFITMYVLVDILFINDRISKIIVQGIVLVLNYLFSKIFVFKNN